MGLESALVIGGCGFVGFHIVNALLEDPTCATVSVISRNPNLNRCEGVSYYAGNINNKDEIGRLLAMIKPQVIFHAGSPRADDPTVEPGDHHQTSVEGTKIVLFHATESPTVKALIYTSTCAVSKGYQHYNIDEAAPLWEQSSKTIPYFKAKALADAMVREANSPLDSQGTGLLTATLRLPLVYGERDNQTIPGMLKTVEGGQTKIQLGNNANLVEPTYVGNAAAAHLLAAKMLLKSQTAPLDPRVDGEAFHITDGDPQPFWTFCRMIWRTAGDKTTPEQLTVIPAWLALGVSHGIEWAYSLFTFVFNATYNISKARTRLGYTPVVDNERHIKKSIEWEVENHKEKYTRLLHY